MDRKKAPKKKTAAAYLVSLVNAVPEPAPGALWAAGGAVTIRGRSARAVWNPSPVLAPVISAAVLVADEVGYLVWCDRRSRRWRTIGDRRNGQGMP